MLWEGLEANPHERKMKNYSQLSADYRETGWMAISYSVEVGCQRCVETSRMIVRRPELRKAVRKVTEEAERGTSSWC